MSGQLPINRLLAASILALVVGLSIVVLAPPELSTNSGSSKTEMLQATSHVRANFRDGDAVKVVPTWHEDQWVHLKDIGTGTQRFPFSALLRCAHCDPISITKNRRVWVIGAEKRDPIPQDVAFESIEPVETKTFSDGSSLSLYEMPAVGYEASLTSSLSETTISRRNAKGEERVCPRVGKRWRCGKKAWENPSVETRDVYHNEVSWVLAHPPANGETLLIDWPVAKANYLLVRAGLTLKAVRKEGGSDISVRILINEEEADRFEIAPHVYTLVTRAIPLPKGESSKVRFEVFAKDHEFRQLMLEADTAMSLPPGLATSSAQSGT